MLTAFSPAKINLFLKVLHRRPDGYHELATLLQAIDLGDILHFELDSHDTLTCTDPTLPINESNLISKAIRLFRDRTGVKIGLKVHLDKRIPIQAGLGGGSSNAATTLWAFNQLTGQKVSEEELQRWSADIGSDVPFFFSSGLAYCTGRGEIVHSLPPLVITPPCLIVKPTEGLSTPEIYKRLKLEQLPNREDPLPTLNKMLSDYSSSHYFNDLEQPAFEVKPELKNLKHHLIEQGFKKVLMSGSGSAFFCLGEGGTFFFPQTSSYQVRFLNRELASWYKTN